MRGASLLRGFLRFLWNELGSCKTNRKKLEIKMDRIFSFINYHGVLIMCIWGFLPNSLFAESPQENTKLIKAFDNYKRDIFYCATIITVRFYQYVGSTLSKK